LCQAKNAPLRVGQPGGAIGRLAGYEGVSVQKGEPAAGRLTYAPASMTRRTLVRSLGLVAALVVLLVSAVWLLAAAHPDFVRTRVAAELARRLGRDVTIDTLSVSVLPRPRVEGAGLVIRLQNHPELPPLVSAAHFSIDVGLLSAFTHHVGRVRVEGLRIDVPPASAASGPPAGSEADLEAPGVIVDHVVVDDARLEFVPDGEGQAPLVFVIHALEIDNVGLTTPMPFHATLTNPVPAGEAETRGTLGPWQRDNPAATPIKGGYTLTHADLATINGLGGTLSSTGRFTGSLSQITVHGQASAPDFSLELGGAALPLSTTFDAVVDSTTGTTQLPHVEATLLDTSCVASGAVVNLPLPGGFGVDFNVEVTDGRIEDLLRLLVNSPTPPLVGDVTLKTALSLPPGSTPVAERLQLQGEFGVGGGQFTDAPLQAKLQELSRRGQGQDKDAPLGGVMTNVTGHFTLADGVARLPDLSFSVPGADVSLAGTYTLLDGGLDFGGTARLQASLSQAVGGLKSVFVRPFNFLFHKDGAGSVVPVTVKGTRDAPRVRVDLKKVIGG
jgi:AsmA-like C-terminal region